MEYIVYHGTNVDFRRFSGKYSAMGGIIWFTDKKEIAEEYTLGHNKIILKCKITLNNPCGWDDYEKYGIGQLVDKNFDGVVLPQGDSTTYIVFNTKQIKILERLNESLVTRILKEAELDGLKIWETSRDYYSGQTNMTVYAELNGKIIGYTDYSIFENEVHIDMVEVNKDFKRKGIATKMFNFIKQENKDSKINYGYTTEEGTGFLKNFLTKNK